MNKKQKIYLNTALKVIGIQLSNDVLFKTIAVYELVKNKNGKASLKDLIKIEIKPG